MRTIYGTIKRFLKQRQWEGERQGDWLQTLIRGENGRWVVGIGWNEDDRWIVVRSMVDFPVPPTRQRAVQEYLTRVNYGLRLASFELDLSDGEVACKTSLSVREDELSEAMLDDLVFSNFNTLDRYLPGLMAVVYGGRSARKAVEQVEGKRTPPPDSPVAPDSTTAPTEAKAKDPAPPATQPPRPAEGE